MHTHTEQELLAREGTLEQELRLRDGTHTHTQTNVITF